MGVVQEHEENVLMAVIEVLWMGVGVSVSVGSVGQYKAGSSDHHCLDLPNRKNTHNAAAG